MQLSNSIFCITASFFIKKCKVWSSSCSVENYRPLSSTSSVALMSSRAFCYHWRHSDVARVLSHRWCLGVRNPFWLFQSNRFFLLPHFFFILRRYLASAFFAGVFPSSLRRWSSHDNLLSLPNYFICQHLFKLLHSFTIFDHVIPMSYPWFAMTWRISFPWKEAVQWLQWLWWWSIIHCCAGKNSEYKLWKDLALFWCLMCVTLVGALLSSWYWWWGFFYGWCLNPCPLGILDICTFSTSLCNLVFWIPFRSPFFLSFFFYQLVKYVLQTNSKQVNPYKNKT